MIDHPIAQGTPGQPPWRDPGRPVAERVDALLAVLSLEEKVGQLGSCWVGQELGGQPDPSQPQGDRDALNVAPMQDVFAGAPALEEASRHGLGHLTRVWGSRPLTVSEGVAELVRQHQVVLANSRLGVPALVHEECLTGFTTYGATVYPAAIAWGATFDPDLVEAMAAAIGADMAGLGVHQGLSPVLDVVRDYRWGRVEETMGEDPYLVSMLGTAYIRGLQSAGVLATTKHFAGYSGSRGARNHGPIPMGRRELADMILPPFEAAVTLAEVGSVMNSYADVDGIPAAADAWLLTDLLRDTWGFEGTVVSDYWAVPFLASMHRVATDVDEAGALALRSGIDVELPDTVGFGAGLVDRVRSGDLEEAAVDRAARRLLTQKVRLGLLDPDWTPKGSVAGASQVDLDGPAHRDLARRLAEESVVLLDPGAALPLLGEDGRGLARIAVVGPCADDPRTFLGCYSFPNHVLAGRPELGLGVDVPTALDALRAEFPDADVVHQVGCAVTGDDRAGFAAAAGPPPWTQTCVSRSSVTRPGCSVGAPPVRAATPRTCDCPAFRPICSTRCSTPARRWWSWSSPVARTRSVRCRAAPPAWCRRSCRGRRAVRPSPASCPGGSSPAVGCPSRSPAIRADSRARTCSRRWGPSTPGPVVSTPPRCSRSATGGPTPASASTTSGSVPPRWPPTPNSQCRSGWPTPANGPARKSSSSI